MQSRVTREQVLEIRQLLLGIEDAGGNIRGVCPTCKGGSGGEQSFSATISSSGEIAFICHRASCGIRGRIHRTHSSITAPVEKPRRLSRLLSDELEPMGDEWLSVLASLYGITERTVSREGWAKTAEGDFAVLPIRDPAGTVRGYQKRPFSVAGFGKPPLTFGVPEAREGSVFLHWSIGDERGFGEDGRGSVVIVEDQVSSAKVAQSGILSLALLGTNVSIDALRESASQASRGDGRLILCLDPDASTKALAYVRALRFVAAGFGASLSARILERDLKYESRERIREIVGTE